MYLAVKYFDTPEGSIHWMQGESTSHFDCPRSCQSLGFDPKDGWNGDMGDMGYDGLCMVMLVSR